MIGEYNYRQIVFVHDQKVYYPTGVECPDLKDTFGAQARHRQELDSVRTMFNSTVRAIRSERAKPVPNKARIEKLYNILHNIKQTLRRSDRGVVR